MAKQLTSTRRRKSGGGKTAADPREAVFAAAMKLAGLQGWADTTMADIADEAGIGLDALHRHFSGKPALLAAFVAHVDGLVLAGTDPEIGDEPVRDRLFDIYMRRFDTLAPYKDGLRAVARELPRDPALFACFLSGPYRRSLEWTLEAARIGNWGPLQPLQLKGLGVIQAAVTRTWLDDDSEDLGKTMAALDKALRRADSIVASFPFGGRRRRAEQAEAGAESA